MTARQLQEIGYAGLRGRPRTVVHLNIADFAVAVERQVDPRLRERPVIVAAGAGARSVVHDMSEEAYRAGIRKSMPLRAALRRCRDAAVLSPHPDRYTRAMSDLFKEACAYSPLVEPGRMDGHLFVDITGTGRIFGPPVDVAWRMYRAVKKRFGFDPIWSVASNKLVAKVATRLVKPVGEYVVGEGEESEFMAPVSLDLVPGIRRDERIRLAGFNLVLAGQVAAVGKEHLETVFGARAGRIHDAVRGADAAPVAPAGSDPEAIGVSRTTGSDRLEIRPVERALYEMTEEIGAYLRARQTAARTLSICVFYADGMRTCRKLSVHPPSAGDAGLFETARTLLYMAWTRRVRLAGIRLSCPGTTGRSAQLELFGGMDGHLRHEALSDAVDRVRERFGAGSVRTGRMLEASA